MNKKTKKDVNPKVKKFYPPVVVVLGHVDHGKTTLLDTIRKTIIAQKEFGGITQKIGASNIEIIHDGQKRSLTFIDTPGHEIFAAMRSRGAQVADIGILVVSSVDGVMPQTKESIKILKAAKIPFIVVLTKSDLPNKNPEKVKGELLKEEVMLEGLGGNVPVIEVSAKKNKNVGELLELILLVYEMEQSNFAKRSEEGEFLAVVIESRLDQKSGPRATVIIKNGTLAVRDDIFTDKIEGRVKTIINDRGQHLNKAIVGDAIEILGFNNVPNVGSIVSKEKKINIQPVAGQSSLVPKPYSPVAKETLPLVIRADTIGSLEAVLDSLPKDAFVISKKTGEVTPADVLFAKSVNAIIVGFNAVIKPEILGLAKTEKVIIKNYSLIYELLDEIKDVLEGKKEVSEEEILGVGKVLASFPYDKTKVMGVVVLDGRIAKGDRIRIVRGEDIIGESAISSVRQGKNPISKAEKGAEAGVIVSPSLDFTIGDMLICHR